MIYKFEGTLSIEALTKPMSLSVENFLLRGSSLRNTDFIYGIVTYTGHETKIMKNSANSRQKKSRLEKKLNWLIFQIFVMQMILCCFAAGYSTLWDIIFSDETNSYLFWN